mmetsp:Transcript_4348/g.13312  ORF Transcript_4348/g.13312 Transcript_4348/m.13312 type:complete len:172 (+) Transcript_4348:126-641(+)
MLAGRRLVSAGVRSFSTAPLQSLSELLSSEEAKQELNRLRGKLGEIAKLKATYGEEPAAIDFEYYKSKLGPELVAPFESTFTALEFPSVVEAEVEGAAADAKASGEHVAEADSLIAASKARIAELKTMIATMEAKKTSETTTIADVYEQFPEIEQEVDEEINNHEWSKDTI